MSKYLTFILFLIITQYAYADVVELNTLETEKCRQQLISSNDPYPIVFMYNKSCPHAQKLMPTYVEISNEVKNRAFFAFDFAQNDGGDYIRASTAIACLGFQPLASPLIGIYSIMPASMNPPGDIGGLIALTGSGDSSKAEILQFINKTNSEKAITMSNSK